MEKELGALADEHALPPCVEELKNEIWRPLAHIARLPEAQSSAASWRTSNKAEDNGGAAWLRTVPVYQDEERKCLELIVEEVEKIARERASAWSRTQSASLIHDGLTVRKELEIGTYRERLETHVALTC
jgi:hypothetical protein